MTMQVIMLSICLCIILSGCNSFSSNRYKTSIFTDNESSEYLDDKQMQIYIDSAELQLLSLDQKASKSCISGQLVIAHDYFTKATAEYNAGMGKDAFITLIALDRQIRKIHCINSYITEQIGCGLTNKKTILKRWYDEVDFQQCNNSMMTKQEMKTNHILITETLHDFNEDKIKPIYYPSLDKLVNLVNSFPQSRLKIHGHSDSKGDAKYNMHLSQKRAQNVIKYFTDKGIDASQIELIASGEENLREIEQSDVSRVFNRYTSITLFLDTSYQM